MQYIFFIQDMAFKCLPNGQLGFYDCWFAKHGE